MENILEKKTKTTNTSTHTLKVCNAKEMCENFALHHVDYQTFSVAFCVMRPCLAASLSDGARANKKYVTIRHPFLAFAFAQFETHLEHPFLHTNLTLPQSTQIEGIKYVFRVLVISTARSQIISHETNTHDE